MREMLTKAYCYEYDFIEEALSAKYRALRSSDVDHWFCCMCRVPVFPKISPLQNCYYSAFSGNPHELRCPHKSDEKEAGDGEPTSVVSVAPPPVYPDVLGEAPPKPRRKFERLSDADLKRLIGAAPTAHVYGSLDEVVDAWCVMSDLSRTTHLLKVGDFTATYGEIFISLDQRKKIPDENFWPRRVYYLDAKLDAGRIAGIYFVRSINKFTGPDGELPISARVRINSDESSKSTNSYNLSDMKAIRIFWHGGIPTLNTSGIGPSYALGGDASVQFSELAIRAR
ncbi:hypothetical protein [Janthinobacterium lividum]|uniref:hypothetical protein n=1 Tax=Janthinobacterium lividum TaxID=29581 RepID=UPI000893806E|nr:hypothetical protein [Janthinobacterium lividum]MCC7716905.1 hypothetical protein [Janthinobacterium lividum]OEZ62312.1 hypothetical protein JANLI_10160 [Janthinobacterium lividum]WQE31853.1 hypothetical protein U0004_30065 [Janthinobacterium lividum]STS86118.1 Uncharacterised protein [Janthinobacterium lividum]